MENKFYQIYSDSLQLSKLDYTPYFNDKCKYIGKLAIADLKDEMSGCDYFAVLSHSLRESVLFQNMEKAI